MPEKDPPASMARLFITAIAGISLVFVIAYLGLFEGLNNYFYDTFLRLRGDRQTSDRILIAAIDESALRQLGRWPIRRIYYARLLDRVKDAKAVGFDIIFAEPSGDDAPFAEAVKRHGRVVLPVYLSTKGKIVGPIPRLLSSRIGHVNIEQGVDVVTRGVYHTMYYEGRLVPSFESALYELSAGSSFKRTPVSFQKRDLKREDTIFQTDLKMINFYGPPGHFKQVSMFDILEGKYPADFFRDKVVLVGVVAPGVVERVQTPLTQLRRGMAGIEFHANVLNNLLDGSDIRIVPRPAKWLLVFVVSVLVLASYMRMNERNAAILWLFSLLLLTITTFFLLSLWNQWVPPAAFYASTTFFFVVSYLHRLDDAARKLDHEYASVNSRLGRHGEGIAQGGLITFLSSGGINAKIENLVSIERHYEEELTAANNKLKELDKLKSMFIASMSHELRTPLNSIIGFTGITLQGFSGELNEEQKDNISRVYQSAKHLMSLISDVIDISKIEAGRTDSFNETVYLKEIVDEATDSLKLQMQEKGLAIAVDVPVGVQLYTDRRRLLQCLLNLLSNAVKFTESGSITITAEESGGMIVLNVSDTGIGIAEKDIPKLFEAFERLDTRVKAGGTGLGLYLTRKIATDILHGKVSVRSREGLGSTFTLTVPIDIETQTK